MLKKTPPPLLAGLHRWRVRTAPSSDAASSPQPSPLSADTQSPQDPDQSESSKVPGAQELKRHSPFGATAKSKVKFGLKITGSWENSVATGVASGKTSCFCELQCSPLQMGL